MHNDASQSAVLGYDAGMDPSTVLLLVAAGLVVAAWFVVRRLALIRLDQARELLARGAAVIDVRSPAEFDAGHVPHAINLPLDTLTERIQAVVNDKEAPLLLHCLSGGRSALAQRRLRRLGYTQVHNLGSLDRAQSLAEMSH
jgi:phage shock protein E